MSKKNKVEINKESLSTSVLGDVKNKKRNPFLLIFILIIFLSVIIFLPDISLFVDKLLNKENSLHEKFVPNNTEKKPNDNIDKEEDLKEEKFLYKPNLEINMTSFLLSDFNYSNDVLKFNVLGLENKSINLNQHNYFLEIYSNNNTLLKRIMLEKDNVNSSYLKNYSYMVDEPSYFELKEINETEYPKVSLTEDSEKKASLYCEGELDEYEYFFEEGKLYSVIYTKDVDDSSTGLLGNEESGITKYINNEEGKYVEVVNLNIHKNITKEFYYNKDEGATKIKFELESNNFICN